MSSQPSAPPLDPTDPGFLNAGDANSDSGFSGSQYDDYWGFATSERWYFPDGVSYVDFSPMNEGDKSKYQKLTSRDLVLERTSGNARMKVDPSTERHELIKSSVTGWNLQRRDNSTGNMTHVPFTSRDLDRWLQVANPKLVEDLEAAIRKANPWLVADLSVEDIDKEIENLKQLRDEAAKRSAGESSSSSK